MGNGHSFKLLLEGLDCANCANKIEKYVNELERVEEAVLNFTTSQLVVKVGDSVHKASLIQDISEWVTKLEPHVKVSELPANYDPMKQKRQTSWITVVQHQKFLFLGTLLFIFTLTLGLNKWFYVASYLLIGGRVLATALRNIRRGQMFDEHFLMMIATLGAFAIGEYPEGIAVMLFYEVGEMFQSYAVNRSRQSIGKLLDIRVDSAHLMTAEGMKTVPVEAVAVGDEIIIKPGERAPLDGIILDGESYLDTSALTGESMLRFATEGEIIWAGSINTSALIKVRTTSTSSTSTVARILELVENAASKKATTERFITKFARVYTPIVVALAILVASVPPLLFGGEFSVWLYRALVFLVVSCPCALVVSIPLGFFAGIGGASKQGVLIKGANYLEMLNQVDTVVFDKTGTLTKGNFKVSEIQTVSLSEDEFMRLAAHAESQSNHPIAKSIVQAYSGVVDESVLSHYEEVAGKGLIVTVAGKQVIVGNEALMMQYDVQTLPTSAVGTVSHMLVDGKYEGYLVIVDEVKETAKAAITRLKAAGVKKVIMLTGDSQQVAEKVASELGIDDVHARLLPHEKVEQVEALLSALKAEKRLVFVGDGMNDAPVLARADIGVAMGGIGSDAAIEAADVVLMKDDPEALVAAINKAKQTRRILWQNIVFALGIKFVVMTLSIFGLATMWLAVFADVGVTILTIINSIRSLKR